MFNWLWSKANSVNSQLTKLFTCEKPEIKKEKSIKVKDINNVKIKVAYIPRTKKFIPNIDRK